MESDMIPIIVMTRNDNGFLESCINSIIENTQYPFHIYVIDNYSDDPRQQKYLNNVANLDSVTLFSNKHNRWILGLNKHLDFIKNSTCSDYFILTDGDIEFPLSQKDGLCWLGRLVSYMEQYKCLGKLGLSLDWEIIEGDGFFKEILLQERNLYNEQRKIAELYISPVDTTAAIYRWDWSISGYKFYPDHIRYLRPELYSCRTARDFLAIHHGWKTYKNNPDLKQLEAKIKCFTLMGADIKETQLNQVRRTTKLYYKLLAKPLKIFWSLRRRYLLLMYFLKKGLRKFDNH